MSTTEGGWGIYWSDTPWGGAAENLVVLTEHIPNSIVWNIFDLMGVRQVDDMDRVQVFIEVTSIGDEFQFFVGSFNLASGGVYPTNGALLDINVSVTNTFTIEWRVKLNALPDSFATAGQSAILLGVNNTNGTCAGLLVSQAGIAYTGAFRFTVDGHFELGHLLDPDATTYLERFLFEIPGSEDWFDEGDEVYIRLAADADSELVYLYVTPASEITPGTPGVVDSSGHMLRAILPLLFAADSAFPVLDRVATYVIGTTVDSASVELFHYNFSDRVVIPNLAPRAVTDGDKAVRLCNIVMLDGSASFDPEGSALSYEWRLIDAPETSAFVSPGSDGTTHPQYLPTGFTKEFYSEELAAEHAISPILQGDVLLVNGIGYTIDSVVEDTPFHVLTEYTQLPDSLLNAQFKLVRHAPLAGANTAHPTFFPDKPGFYLVDLRVFDGVIWSSPTGLNRATSLINVVESPLPRGCTPDLSFLYNYISDFWKLLEDPEVMSVLWSGIAQVVATELYTLWQHEYSKSIRDIQRTFIRRWLHYDLLLGEPIPELTRVRTCYGGVYSTDFTTLQVKNTRLVLTSSVFAADVRIEFTAAGVLDPVSFATNLGRYLRKFANETMSVQLLDGASGHYRLRIDAPFAFSIGTDTTSPLFVAGDANGLLYGVGYRVLDRTFRVDKSVEGLDLIGCFLIVGDNCYTIERIATDNADPYPYQRLVVQEYLDVTIPDEVSGESVTYVVCGWVSSELLNFYDGLVSRGDVVDIHIGDTTGVTSSIAAYAAMHELEAYGASISYPGKLPIDTTTLGEYVINPDLTVSLARVVRRTYVPVDEAILDIPILQERIVVEDTQASLRRNLDFFLDTYRGKPCIRFVSGQDSSFDVFEGERPPDRLWAEYSYLDNSETIEAQFGLAVGLSREQAEAIGGTIDYYSAVAGLLYAYSHGPSIGNMRIGTQILLGLPYAEEEGTIIEVRDDLLSHSGRILVRDSSDAAIVRSYTYPNALSIETNPTTGLPYAVGDVVQRFAPLVSGVSIVDYVSDPIWFAGLVYQGSFKEVEKYNTFAVRVSSDIYSLSSLLIATEFILGIKPTYTHPRILVELLASGSDGDEASITDTITTLGSLTLDDAIGSNHTGSSLVFDQAWPGGGQPWVKDPAPGTGAYRNRFDNDDDLETLAVYPTADSNIVWAYDKEYLIPEDVVITSRIETYGTSFTPSVGSVFSSYAVYQSFSADVTEASAGAGFTIPAGPTGYTYTLLSSTVGQTGSLAYITFQLLGLTASSELSYILRVTNVTSGLYQDIPFVTGTGTEGVAASTLAVTAGDTLSVSLRTASGLATHTSWYRMRVQVLSIFTWNFSSTLAAGVYIGSDPVSG